MNQKKKGKKKSSGAKKAKVRDPRNVDQKAGTSSSHPEETERQEEESATSQEQQKSKGKEECSEVKEEMKIFDTHDVNKKVAGSANPHKEAEKQGGESTTKQFKDLEWKKIKGKEKCSEVKKEVETFDSHDVDQKAVGSTTQPKEIEKQGEESTAKQFKDIEWREVKGKKKSSKVKKEMKIFDTHDVSQKTEVLTNQPEEIEEQAEFTTNQFKDLEREKDKGKASTKEFEEMTSELNTPDPNDLGINLHENQATEEALGGPPVSDSYQFLSFDNLKFPVSPGAGTSGRKINLIVNYFKLKCNLTRIYHYDVEVKECQEKGPGRQTTSTSIGRRRCQEIFALFVDEMRKRKEMSKFDPVYDGNKNFFTSSELPLKEITIPVFLEVEGKKKKFTITVKPVKKSDGTNIINMRALQNWSSHSLDSMSEILLALNAIMNYRNVNSQEVRTGRSFFCLKGKQNESIGEGLEIWGGYNQSVHITAKGPVVILNLSSKVFHKNISVIEYANEILGRDIRKSRDSLAPYEIKKLEKALKGVRVHVTHLPYKRRYYIKGVSDVPAEDFKIDVNNKLTTVAEYFQQRYSLTYPHLNCLQMRTNTNKTYIPFEVCEVIEGQPRAPGDDASNANVTTKVISRTAVQPKERFGRIQEYAKKVGNEQMKKFNLFMDLEPMKVQGRVIAPPLLKYDGSDVSPVNGTWGIKGKFVKTLRNESWILLHFVEQSKGSNEALKDFSKKLENVCHSFGLILGKFKGIVTFEKNVTVETALKKEEVKKSSLVVIVLSKKDRYHNYDEIKFIADYGLRIVTQCVLEDMVQVRKLTQSYLVNVCLKINAKLGGVNHRMVENPKVLKEPVIIFGADVVHSTMCPSIAAVVGSLDAYPSKYKVSCRVQENKKRGKKSQEIILDLEEMVKIILKAFKENTRGRDPLRIIFFRDGVSEGQFEAVRNHEVNCIRKASSDVIGQCIPLTFIVVQKRHQTRLRPENSKDGIGKTGNIPPGTTVDTEITYPNSFDYFQCSHEGLRGTSKPARYTVLFDENNFPADELQQLSNDMCYMYARCTKSVSIPAPVKYADLAAYRAKKYADFQLKKCRLNNTLVYHGPNPELPEFALKAINKMEDSKNHLFFL